MENRALESEKKGKSLTSIIGGSILGISAAIFLSGCFATVSYGPPHPSPSHGGFTRYYSPPPPRAVYSPHQIIIVPGPQHNQRQYQLRPHHR
ncbi:MAG: hypothetical protein WCK90_04640 [archaeon]